MPINREAFNESFTNYNIPDWNCPSCRKGKLFLDKKNITVYETNESKKDQRDLDWEPYWLVRYFIGIIICNNPKCKEVITIAGNVKTEEDYNDEQDQSYTDNYYPCYIFPIINIFRIPEDTPSDVVEAILSAFKVFWIDKSACANAIRTAVEIILNDKRVLKTELTKSKKRRNRSLHDRIELFGKKDPKVAEHLMAIKWIGNVGSHQGEITNEDLLDGFELLKHSLEKLYTSHEKNIAEITRQINKRRKPR